MQKSTLQTQFLDLPILLLESVLGYLNNSRGPYPYESWRSFKDILALRAANSKMRELIDNSALKLRIEILFEDGVIERRQKIDRFLTFMVNSTNWNIEAIGKFQFPCFHVISAKKKTRCLTFFLSQCSAVEGPFPVPFLKFFSGDSKNQFYPKIVIIIKNTLSLSVTFITLEKVVTYKVYQNFVGGFL